MYRVRFFAFLTFLVCVFYSCDPCRNLDCLYSNYHGRFRIISAADGRDLVFGPARIYDKNQIRFYSLKGTDTAFLEYQTIKLPDTGPDSILYVHFFPKTDVAYMRLGNGDVDTLHITYNTFGSRCCGTITEITNFRFNNAVDLPGSRGTREIKK